METTIENKTITKLSESHKITICRICDKQKLCARESRLCSVCGGRLIERFINHLSLPGLVAG